LSICADRAAGALWFPCGVRVIVCGELRVEGATAVVTQHELPGRLGRRLWTYLVLNRRRPVGNDELATALWGDEMPDAWDASLHALVSRLRRTLAGADGGVAIRPTGAGYALALPIGTFVDRERAWEAIHHVRAIQRRGEAAAAWAEAVIAHEISARGFLPGGSGEWIEAERRLLRGIELQSLEAIADAELAQQRPGEAERVARSLIGLDPLRESGYRLLMRSHAAAGNDAAVLDVMTECRAALGAVGASPSAETERLFRTTLGKGRLGFDAEVPNGRAST
jgi:DNA-binding SARP family transcriptional activator